MATKTPKIDKLLNVLATGDNYPINTLERRSGLANISAAVNTLRKDGYRIFLNTKKVKGKKVNMYRLAV
jgi:predicted transcriptional regulator